MTDKTDEFLAITDALHTPLFKLMGIAIALDPNNADLELMRERMSLAKNSDPLVIMTSCKDQIWKYHEQILAQDTQFFMELAGAHQNDDKVVNSIIISIKQQLHKLTNSERAIIWGHIKAILEAVVRYKKASGEFAAQ